MWQWLPIALQVLTALPGLIQAAESAFSGHDRAGTAKKDLVVGSVKAGLAIAAQAGTKGLTADRQDLVAQTAGALTDSIVQTMNAAGALKAKVAPAS